MLGRISPRTFLTSMAPVISGDPVVFMKAAAAVVDWSHREGGLLWCYQRKKRRKRTNQKLRVLKNASGFSNSDSNSHKNILLHDKKVFAFSIRYIQFCLKMHPPTTYTVPDTHRIRQKACRGSPIPMLLKLLIFIEGFGPLESTSRVANASEQVIKCEGPNKKKTTVSSERHDEQRLHPLRRP
ncbi:unnamed protein product [Dovyalis caffra]|uniref:Uncharacterized protein n=1 Tax=Dovyalis caffra TaxID=77055 RepID=A0AAV1SI20_9ROSI|nr:unnamed protein product [Dovyalis caffra]